MLIKKLLPHTLKFYYIRIRCTKTYLYTVLYRSKPLNFSPRPLSVSLSLSFLSKILLLYSARGKTNLGQLDEYYTVVLSKEKDGSSYKRKPKIARYFLICIYFGAALAFFSSSFTIFFRVASFLTIYIRASIHTYNIPVYNRVKSIFLLIVPVCCTLL